MPDVATRPLRASRFSPRSGLALAVLVAASYLAGLVGSVGMGDGSAWYATLEKPSWTPSGALIGAVWSVLYGLMGVAAWLAWRAGGGWRGSRVALGLFAAQLVLNTLWSPIFFGLRAVGAALVEIVLLEALVIATTVAFWRLRPLAGALMLPYAAWVAFASYLNLRIWQLNL